MSKRMSVSGTRPAILWSIMFIAGTLVVGLIVGVLILYPNYQRQQAVEQHYQAGVVFQSMGDWQAAQAEFKQVITLEATYEDTQERLVGVSEKIAERDATATAVALSLSEQKQLETQVTATAIAMALSQQAQTEAQTATVVAMALSQQKQTEAQATIIAAPAATTEALEAQYQKGLGYMNLARWEEAKLELELVFAVDPNYKEVQAKLAQIGVEVTKLVPTATSTPVATATPVATVTPVPPALTLDGYWDLEVHVNRIINSSAQISNANSKYNISILLAQEGTKLTGEYLGASGRACREAKINGEVQGNQISWIIHYTGSCCRDAEMQFEGRVSLGDDTLEGNLTPIGVPVNCNIWWADVTASKR